MMLLRFVGVLIIARVAAAASFADYFQSVVTYFADSKKQPAELLDFQQKVPYELSPADDKFIAEAIKLTGVSSSELDTCQHRVVLQLRTSCHKLNDEELAKLAVMLLNCQSAIEGRRMYPCTESMSIKDCTLDMDSVTWNTYHLMSNRAKAVCFYVRNVQFRGLTEHTVNQLMNSAQQQLQKLGEIADDQKSIQDIATETIQTISKGYTELSVQQKDVEKAQLYGQLAIEENIRRLADEKYLIKESKELLASMTASLNNKLENAVKQLESQSQQSHINHEELISDLLRIQNMAGVIFKQIDDSSRLLMAQNDFTKLQYNLTLTQLAEVNSTIHTLVQLVGGTKQALEERLVWITQALGGTDMALERLYVVLWHCAFLIVSMITCAFLSAYSSTRIVVAVLPPVNLILALNNHEHALNPLWLAGTIGLFILAQTVTFFLMKIKKRLSVESSLKKQLQVDASSMPKISVSSFDYKPFDDDEDRYLDTADVDKFEDFLNPTPPMSRVGFSRSRSRTPLLNKSLRGPCGANTRAGTPCKLSSLPGRDFCYRHQHGDSVMGDR